MFFFLFCHLSLLILHIHFFFNLNKKLWNFILISRAIIISILKYIFKFQFIQKVFINPKLIIFCYLTASMDDSFLFYNYFLFIGGGFDSLFDNDELIKIIGMHNKEIKWIVLGRNSLIKMFLFFCYLLINFNH